MIYLLPLEQDPDGTRGPKYFPWRRGQTGTLMPKTDYTMAYFGEQNLALFSASLAKTDSETLIAQPDVIGVPDDRALALGADFDELISMLKGCALPVDWIDASLTWESILAAMNKLCAVKQRAMSMAVNLAAAKALQQYFGLPDADAAVQAALDSLEIPVVKGAATDMLNAVASQAVAKA